MSKSIRIAVLIPLLAFLYFRGIEPAWTSLQSDFPTYYVSSRLLIDGASIDSLYDSDWFRRQIHNYNIDFEGRFSPFPPSNAFIMLPVAGFEPLTAKRIWTLLNILLLAWAVFLLRQLTAWPWLDCTLFILVTGAALANNFRYGKVYLLLCCLIFFAHLLQSRGREILAGILLGICTSLKYFPLIFVAGYFFNRRFKITVSAIVTVGIVVAVQIIIFGLKANADFLHIALFPHLGGEIEDVSPFAIAFQSWESFLRNVFVYDMVYNPHPLVDWPIGKNVVHLLIVTLFLFLVVRKSKRIYLENRPHYQAAVLALPAFLALSLLPAGATYHFLFMIFPLAIYLKAFVKDIGRTRAFVLIGIYAGIGFIPFGWILGIGIERWGLLLSYPRLWLITSFLLLTILFIRSIRGRGNMENVERPL